jgi:hypothetical protein
MLVSSIWRGVWIAFFYWSAAQRPLLPFVEAIFDYSRTMVEVETNRMKGFIQEVEVGNAKN